MKYKGYWGADKFDEEASIFHGEVMNNRDVITFQGDSIDDYPVSATNAARKQTNHF